MNKTLEITLINEAKTINIDYGSLCHTLISKENSNNNIIAALVNNEIKGLNTPLKINSSISFITTNDPRGLEVYRRSLAFLLLKVVTAIYPDRQLVIGHSLGNGYYFDLKGKQLTEGDLKTIKEEMLKDIKSDIPIVTDKVSYMEAINNFKDAGRFDKLKLLESFNMASINIYKCDDFWKINDGPLAASTGQLQVFDLLFYPPGFVLIFPEPADPGVIGKFVDNQKIFHVYREYKEWGKSLNVHNVGSLNERIRTGEIYNFIQVNESLHTKKIINIASDICSKAKSVRLISIAGPSSSGKTTFGKRLSIDLQAHGLKPVMISLDNYFVNRTSTPQDELGNPDYESIDALNIKLLNEQLETLLRGKPVRLPQYNFFTGISSFQDRETMLRNDEVILIEGIHGLNDKLTYIIPQDMKYKIYISALTQMNIDDNTRIPTTDNRIIRRMVRDYKYRGHSAKRTLQMWPSVRRGEEKWIFPFQNNADAYFNSALDYELGILKSFAEPVLMQIKPDEEEYAEAVRLLRFLKYFLNIQPGKVPQNSILREFIGDSAFHY